MILTIAFLVWWYGIRDPGSGPLPCICGCGTLTDAWFAPGHDWRLYGWAVMTLRGERDVSELSEMQLHYLLREGDMLSSAQRRQLRGIRDRGSGFLGYRLRAARDKR